MSKIKSCAFTGHRPQSLPFNFAEDDNKYRRLKEIMREIIVDLIENKGVTRFISGMAVGVDMLASEIVLEEKKGYPEIQLECALPCETQSIRWRVDQQERYYQILATCDKTTMLQHAYTKDCMKKRNYYMVDNADYIVAVWNGRPSGTGSTVQYALKREKKIIVIDPNNLDMEGRWQQCLEAAEELIL